MLHSFNSTNCPTTPSGATYTFSAGTSATPNRINFPLTLTSTDLTNEV